VGLIGLLILGWRGLPARERRAAFVALALLGGILFTVAGLSRLSYGASPPGSELLTTEETPAAFRAMFREMNVLASANPNRVLRIDLPQTSVATWYGRSIPQGSGARAGSTPWVLQPITSQPTVESTQPTRIPWQTRAEIDPRDVNPLGILRWLANRSALVRPNTQDIIVTR